MDGICIEAVISSLPEALAYVRTALAASRVPEHAAMEVELAVDEAVTNIIMHGFAGGGGRIRVLCTFDEEEITIRIEDRAPPFDPTGAEAPDTDADIDERPIGGLGIHFIRQMTDEMQYRRQNGRNILILKKHVQEGR
ncbi:ATP-binding protein [Methanofollis fontis]|uniref:ATP-binding protein n=1 Tax=Methanofollis fontis TaxID=2052832 RepID=A0A483CXA5_9EURY|nr:ATP-binding protein [Methanofollis fontis]TAJ43853.1 ATP-binding protein [Methanofollis fontis]